MNRRIHAGILVAVVCLAFGLLTGCNSSSKPAPTIAITATGGTPQTGVATGAAFAALSATVTSNGTPVSGVSVTFTAPSSGASCAFTGGATETDTTNSSGVAISSACTANSTAGAFTVTATTSGATTPASFSLTSVAAVTQANYVFYASGQDLFAGSLNYYSVAGVVTVDSNGNVLGGEEDYNDAFGAIGAGEPNTPDTIAAGGTVTVDPTTGLGTAIITSSNTNTGVAGVQTFAIQFVNPNHALITEFDGFATSSGSLDLQSATALTGPASFAFAMSGVDTGYFSWGFGGVFTTDGSGNAAGFVDINDDGTVTTANALTATSGTPDAFGRNVVTVSTPAITLATYPVGPEVMRMIDVDTTDAAVGSALGQGSATFDNSSLPAGVFSEIGQWTFYFGAVGEFTADTTGTFQAGSFADDNELDTGVELIGQDQSGSTYNLVGTAANGYGSMSLNNLGGDVSLLGVYMVDPALNINDPNNKSTDLGGALIVDLSPSAATQGGMGVISLQTDTTATDFNGSYAAGFQNFNFLTGCGCEFDMVGPFTIDSTTEALSTASIGADDSDPVGTITGTAAESTGDTYSSIMTIPATGAFDMNAGNSNPLAAVINGTAVNFDADIFMASATTLYWINTDQTNFATLFVGSLQGQSSVVRARVAKRAAPKATRKATKSVKQAHEAPSTGWKQK